LPEDSLGVGLGARCGKWSVDSGFSWSSVRFGVSEWTQKQARSAATKDRASNSTPNLHNYGQ